jgi:hypothetical protein
MPELVRRRDRCEESTDERLLIMARNFTRAAELITNSISAAPPDPAAGVWGDWVDGRSQTMHVRT